MQVISCEQNIVTVAGDLGYQVIVRDGCKAAIVQAVDAHDDLLNALEIAEATINRLERHAPGSAKGTLDVIHAATAKATEGRTA